MPGSGGWEWEKKAELPWDLGPLDDYKQQLADCELEMPAFEDAQPMEPSDWATTTLGSTTTSESTSSPRLREIPPRDRLLPAGAPALHRLRAGPLHAIDAETRT
jgi:hypothetical protein